MKTFSFRLGDLDGNAYDIHRTCVIGVIDLYRCHRPGNASDRAHASDRARMKTFSFRLGDLDGNAYDIHRTSDVYMSVIRKCIRSSSDEDILVSSGRLGWRWFRLGNASDRARMKTHGNASDRARIKTHRPGNASSGHV